jgi:Uncharacterized protein containing a von Willebrand factor type A (vWA) domain
MKKTAKAFAQGLAIVLAVLLAASGCGTMAAEGSGAAAPYEAWESYNAGIPYEAPETPYDTSAEEYGSYVESGFHSPADDPLSTFSIDVDTASYSNIRRYLTDGALPPEDAVRVEECINYFTYGYANPMGDDPISAQVTISDCPWNEGRYLARVSLKAREIDLSEAPASNLVFLLDVSGSMNGPEKLPLVKDAMMMLAETLREEDRVSIVVYAGASGLILDGCSGSRTSAIEAAIGQLSAGGSTAGGEGINLAYYIAEKNFIEGGNNRVILCTDGDFNVGVSSTEGLEALIEQKSGSGVYLSVLGFGTGNTKDNRMETLADKGDGNYAYIDTLLEAKKVLVNEMSGTLFTMADDVKVQVEFNPKAVSEYRLVGYDNRILNAEDFNDDEKDAGEMGAGHCVTVFYEIIPVGGEGSDSIDDLVFQQDDEASAAEPAADWFYLKIRYKQPGEADSRLMTVMAGAADYAAYPDEDYRFASAVAEFALLLKGSQYAGDASFPALIERARAARGVDTDGYRAQFVQLAELAEAMMP